MRNRQKTESDTSKFCVAALYAALIFCLTTTSFAQGPFPGGPGTLPKPNPIPSNKGPLSSKAGDMKSKIEAAKDFIESKLGTRKWNFGIPEQYQDKKLGAQKGQIDATNALGSAGVMPASIHCAEALDDAFHLMQGSIAAYEKADKKKKYQQNDDTQNGEDPDEERGKRLEQECREVLEDVIACANVTLGGSITIQNEKPKPPIRLVVSTEAIRSNNKGKPIPIPPPKKKDEGCPCPQFPVERKTSWLLRITRRPPSNKSWNSLFASSFSPKFFFDGDKEQHTVDEAAAKIRRVPSSVKALTNVELAKYGVQVAPDYRTIFFAYYPELKPFAECFEVHHAIEQRVLEKYPDLFSAEEINDICNMRGICGTARAWLHRQVIDSEWRIFYETHPPGQATRQQFLNKAADIDRSCGLSFIPYAYRAGVYFDIDKRCNH